jgi:DNA-binding CsgD family transcriptional regulator
MQDLLGWRGEDLAERGWMATCVLARDRSTVEQLVAHGMSGAIKEGELPLVARDGRKLLMHVRLSREISGRARGLVVVAEDVRESPASNGRLPAAWDCSCVVSRAPDTLGIVQSMHFLDPAREGSDYVGQPLGAILAELGCTEVAHATGMLLDPQCNDLVYAVLPDAEHSFCLVTACAVNETDLRVTVRYVDAGLLPAIVEAKVKRVAETRGLSDRERQVLQLLLRGRGLEDIAAMLEIAPRTVKFHQANVLQKLGADSRLDLLRVVL